MGDVTSREGAWALDVDEARRYRPLRGVRRGAAKCASQKFRKVGRKSAKNSADESD